MTVGSVFSQLMRDSSIRSPFALSSRVRCFSASIDRSREKQKAKRSFFADRTLKQLTCRLHGRAGDSCLAMLLSLFLFFFLSFSLSFSHFLFLIILSLAGRSILLFSCAQVSLLRFSSSVTVRWLQSTNVLFPKF